MTLIKSWVLYFGYLVVHKYYVASACASMGLLWRGLTHDMSKFRPSEFFPYAKYFFGKWRGDVRYEAKPPRSTHAKYDFAWLKHKHRNEHHWQYWVTVNDLGEFSALPMPQKAVEEMVCDWYGAGKAQRNPLSTRQWFESKKNTLILHKDTVSRIYRALHKLEVVHG